MSIKLLKLLICFLISFNAFSNEDEKLRFVENKGQFESNVLYRVELNAGYIFLERNSITFKIFSYDDFSKSHSHPHNTGFENDNINGHVLKYNFVNSNKNIGVYGELPFFEKYNYFLGKDKSKWATDVQVFKQVVYNNIYNGVDLKLYSKNGKLKYEWIVKPGADIKNIKLEINGADSLKIGGNSLIISTSIGQIFDKNLNCWINKKDINKSDIPINCSYELKNNILNYKVDEKKIDEYEITIDPILVFSTYSGSKGDNFGFTATYDLNGNLYAGGITDNTHGEFPVTTGAFQTKCKGGNAREPVNLPCDITISKYDSSGRNLIYATYIGGSDDDYPHSMVVNSDTELVVFGTTYSKNFPMNNEGFDTTHSNKNDTFFYTDIVIFKLSKNGNSLQSSTYFGGTKNDGLTDIAIKYNYADEFRGEVLTDKNDNIYVVSSTNSNNIPTVNATKSAIEGPADGVCMKFSKDLKNLLWSTYFGGNGSDGIYSLEFDKDENIYIAGGTFSTNLKTHSNAYTKTTNGGIDGFVAMYNKTSFSLDKLTYFGTGAYDQIYFLEIDKKGDIYCAGQTEGDITASSGVYSNLARTGQFIMIMNQDLSKVKKQTVFGARVHNPEISPSAFLVDSCGSIYLSGWGSSIHRNGTTKGLPITSNALQTTTDNNDFYLAVFGKNLSSLLYATYFGGNQSGDHVDGGTSRFDKRGVIYQSVCSSCPPIPGSTISDFPTTSNSAFPKNVSWRCSNAAFKIDFQINNLVQADFLPDTVVCGPADIQFVNKSTGNGRYIWNFGDGKQSTISNPSHSFDKEGNYTVKLIAIDSNTCNNTDTAINNLLVLKQSEADFEIKTFKCSSKIEIINKSNSYETADWNFGDGSTFTGNEPKFYEFKKAGLYKIELITDKSKLCPDTAIFEINIEGTPEDKIIPINVFTPDGDGVNDCYKFDGGLNECSEIELTIYNRWGLKVFETKDFYECWNGKIFNKGKLCPEGTYFYIFRYKGLLPDMQEYIEGTVTLIRK
ncbi:MAG: gliding motility-associated C-terminal domain-containing protein [Bacteroidia bacterium]|nr:gliding motility-associated C-terminal domain-containing protein [Bacteroidia bacterium]